MDTAIVIALAIAVPIVLFPVALVWYINIGGMRAAVKEAREKRAAAKEAGTVLAREPPPLRTRSRIDPTRGESSLALLFFTGRERRLDLGQAFFGPSSCGIFRSHQV